MYHVRENGFGTLIEKLKQKSKVKLLKSEKVKTEIANISQIAFFNQSTNQSRSTYFIFLKELRRMIVYVQMLKKTHYLRKEI